MNNFFIQDQIDFSLVKTNAANSISKRFIIKKNVQFIHDSIFANNTSDWEERLISNAITLAYKQSINDLNNEIFVNLIED